MGTLDALIPGQAEGPAEAVSPAIAVVAPVSPVMREIDLKAAIAEASLRAVAGVVIAGAQEAVENLLPTFEYATGGHAAGRQLLVQRELIWFFFHLVMRTALADGVTSEQLHRLRVTSEPLLATALEAANAADATAFASGMDSAGAEYGSCERVIPDDLRDRDSLFGRFAERFAAVCWRRDDPSVLLAAISVSVAAFESMRIERVIQDMVGALGGSFLAADSD